MKTQLEKQHSFMIIIVVAGLILAALAFLKPANAEAGVVVRALAKPFLESQAKVVTERLSSLSRYMNFPSMEKRM